MFQIVANGDVPDATYFNGLMRQSIIPCTSITRPSSPVDGMTIYETDHDLLRTWNGTAWQITGGERTYARKTGDETVNNSATLQDDDQLFLPVVAGAVYEMRLRAYFVSPPTPDIKFGWGYPAGTKMWWTAIDAQTGTTLGKLTETDVAAVVTIGPTWQTQTFEGAVIVGGTSGTLNFRWAQNGANPSNTIVHEGSMLMLERVA